jgi:uncharacterized protein (TIGR02466 family)
MSRLENAPAYADAKIALLRRAIELKPNSVGQMFDLADLLAERGEFDEYARIFQSAYKLDPRAQRLLEIDGYEARALRHRAQALVGRGVNYSAVLAALAISSAKLGERATVERLIDYGRLFRLVSSVWPRNFSDDDFFASLAAEIRSGLRFYKTPDVAIRQAWRHNDILNSDAPACRALAGEIRTQVNRYIANLPPETSHPFVASQPAEFRIEAWAVVSGAESHHRPHVHPRAWASGVYYVVCPAISREASSERGWLRIGPPAEYGSISDQDGWQTRMVAPEPGTLVLMPAYFFHDTSPMGVDQERICIAFDVTPLEFEPFKQN